VTELVELVGLLPLLEAARAMPKPTKPMPATIKIVLEFSICAVFTPAGLPAVSGAANAFVANMLTAKMATLKVRIYFSIKQNNWVC
jgi:hypothetical protein